MPPAWRKALKMLGFASPCSLSHTCLQQRNWRLLQTSPPGTSWLPLAPSRSPCSDVIWSREEQAVGGACARRSCAEGTAEQKHAGGSFSILAGIAPPGGENKWSIDSLEAWRKVEFIVSTKGGDMDRDRAF